MSEVYGIGSNSFSLSQTIFSRGVPVNNTRANIPLGLTCIDITTNPRTIYQWDGEIWQVSSSATAGILRLNADTGFAVPSLGIISLLGQNVSGSGVGTSATGSTVSYRMQSPYSLGNFLFTGGNIQVIRSANAQVLSVVTNTSTSGSGDAVFQGGVLTTGGDAYLQVGVSGFGAWCTGIRNSDSQTYHITAGNTLGTGVNYVRITSGGVISFPNSGFTVGAGLYTAASGVLTSLPGGQFIFAAGTHASIPVASITANSVVTYSTVALGTVTTVQGILTTITPGVGFVPTSNDATDTSTVNWSIVRL